MRDPLEIFEAWLEKRYPRIYARYLDYNFCKGYTIDGSEKPMSSAYRLFYKIFYLDCACCSALRGLIIGFILGVMVSWVLKLV